MDRNKVTDNKKQKSKNWKLISSIIIFCLMNNAEAFPIDSLRLETINGKQFIIHQVDPKETLYSISRKYGVTVALIRDENPDVDAGLAVGQIVKVPYLRAKPKTENGITIHKVIAKETLFSISKLYNVSVEDIRSWNNLKDNSISLGQDLTIRRNQNNPTVETVKAPDMKRTRGNHVVTEKETLFSISKMYGASVAQLKSWNNLTTDEVKPGQVLLVLPPMTIPETQQPMSGTQEVKISETVIGSDEIHEKGVAEIIEGTEGNRKYLAQHKSAKKGTIMKVRNEANNHEVFVRVIGPLDAGGSTIIKVSRAALERLGTDDPKFNVELIYYK